MQGTSPFHPARWLARVAVLALMLVQAAHGLAAPTPVGSPRTAPLAQAVQSYQRGDIAAARAEFERLSALGVPAADYNLAVMHLRSELPDANLAQALHFMTRAAQGGFVTAMVGLAQLLERGEAGLKRDLPAAYGWYLRAAQLGSVDAQLEVGTAHFLGRGAPRDLAAAAQWYREAAKAGDEGAAYLLASMYEQGDGVERDRRLAIYWYEAAARAGDIAARAKAKALLAQEEAEARAQDKPDAKNAPPAH